MQDKKCCSNCIYFNGHKYDGMRICSEREGYVHENSCCYHHVTDPEKYTNQTKGDDDLSTK